MERILKHIEIARICHEANRALCQAIGDNSHSSWEESPPWHKQSLLNGVMAIADGSVRAPHQSHDRWCTEKLSDGWRYGEEKDTDNKRHPCLVSFEQLPRIQQAKDILFFSIAYGLIYNSRATDGRVPPMGREA